VKGTFFHSLNSSRAVTVTDVPVERKYRMRAEEIEGVGGTEAKKVRDYSTFRSFTDYASPTTRSIPDRSILSPSYSRIEGGTSRFIAT